jgi:uncharacterized protein (TIGR00299 family) protein
MARIAYFDCFSGVSGDMVLGALLHAGLDIAALEAELRKLPLEGWHIHTGIVRRHSIAATRVEVHTSDHADGPAHTHEHPDDHDAGHSHRGLSDVMDIIHRSGLSEPVQRDATRIFARLAEAEAAAHRVATQEVYFHEVGAVDAIVDIVGAAAALHALGVEEVYASPLPVSRGFVRSAHGQMPLPAPGTMELLKGVPIYPTEGDTELVTPTGAAILTTLAREFGPMPEMVVGAVGYGAGGRDLAERPNMLRVLVGDRPTSTDVDGLLRDRVLVLETNLDDQSPESFGYILDRLLDAGALDAYFTPIVMKKGRPGYQLSVLAEPTKADDLAGVVLAETTTFGVRLWEASRRKLAREFVAVDTPYGTVRVKVGRGGGVEKASPEFEDCRRLAEAARVPLREVYEAATCAYAGPRGRANE